MFTTRVYLTQKYLSLVISGDRIAKDIKYRPNSKLNMGLGITYGWFTLNLAFALGLLNNGDDGKGKTKSLLKLYKDAATRRNEIAHAMVMGTSQFKIENNRAIPLPTSWFLVPPLFATKKNEMFAAGPKYRYSTREISSFSRCFEELAARAANLSPAIRAFYALTGKDE